VTTVSADTARDTFSRDRAWELVKRLPAYGRLAFSLSREPDLPKARRIAILGALAYLVSPIDAIPGLIPLLGQVDDVLVVLLTLRFALTGLSPERRHRHMASAGIAEPDIDQDLETIAAMGAWLLRTGARTGVRATRVGTDIGGRLLARAGRDGPALAARFWRPRRGPGP
jgi:uncharacterized membrane protein YkvA (DUF1232 family)